jgi:amino acid transporter
MAWSQAGQGSIEERRHLLVAELLHRRKLRVTLRVFGRWTLAPLAATEVELMSSGLDRLGRGNAIAAVGAVALFVFLFLPWYSLPGGNVTRFLLATGGKPIPPTGTAWQAYATIIYLLVALVIAALVMAGLAASGRAASAPSAPKIVTVFGLLMIAVVAYKIANPPGANRFNDPDYGAYLGLAAIVVITIGGILAWREQPQIPSAEADDAAPA